MEKLEKHLLRLKNPIYWIAFIVLAIGLVSAFPQLGMDGVMWIILGSGVLVIIAPIGIDAVKKSYKNMMEGKPTRLDWAVAPGGYRRSRASESEEEAVAQTVVSPTPNRPLVIDVDPNAPTVPLGREVIPASPVAVEKHQEKASGIILRLATGCNPPIDMVLGRAVLFLGMRGSGKSNALARFLEQVCRFPIPALIGDYEEDYLTLPDVLSRCLVAGSPSWDGQYRCDKYWKVTSKTAQELGYAVLEYGVQVILQIGSYATLEESAEIMTGAIRGMFKWAEEQDPRKRVPCLICLDEAQHFLPQNSQVSNIKEEQANELLKAFMDVNARGRKRGLTPVIATQRPAQIRKEVIGGSEIYFLMKQTMARDLVAYEELLGRENINRQMVASFEKGEGLVYEGGEISRIRFLERQSEHKSNTPGLEQALDRYGDDRPAISSRTFNFAMIDDEESEEIDTEELEAFDDEEEEEMNRLHASLVTPVMEEKEPDPERSLKADERKVLAAYRENYRTGNAIAGVTGIPGTRVNQILNKLGPQMGLIDWKPRVRV